ncbi:MAG: hypothetical protein D6763_12140 [Alphaproteobacteria bacterium]|nr:MAG: hypothetical protein D6763_12140 [Alphaproteobacteria bacterium]
MAENPVDRDKERMSVRNSLLVWVSGAVLGWVVAVVAIYGLLRASDESVIADSQEMSTPASSIAQEHDPTILNKIEPAAGPESPE